MAAIVIASILAISIALGSTYQPEEKIDSETEHQYPEENNIETEKLPDNH